MTFKICTMEGSLQKMKDGMQGMIDFTLMSLRSLEIFFFLLRGKHIIKYANIKSRFMKIQVKLNDYN